MRVLLINPPQEHFDGSSGYNFYIPIGLLSLAGAVRDICSINILDCSSKNELKKTKESVIYGVSQEEIKERIKKFNPELIGITIPFSAQSEMAKMLAKIGKEINPNIKIVFGGPHASVRYEKLLKEGVCDFCVVGEGEETLRRCV